MNQIKKSSKVPVDTEEEIEVVEGELIGTGTAVEKTGTSSLVSRGTFEFATVIGSAALGLFKIFRMFYGNNSSGKASTRMHRRRRRR